MFMFNWDFRYVRICICGRTSSYMCVLNSSLLGNKGGGSSHKLVRPESGCGQRQFMYVAKDNSWVWPRTIHGCGQVQYTLFIQNTLFSCLL